MAPENRRSPFEPIAVIGMACRFPGGGNDLAGFWRVLSEGIDASGDVPRERWDAEAYYDPVPNAPGKSYTKRASFLKGVDIFQFDAEFFGIPPVEARVLDPQQRLLLEVIWEATEHACLSLKALQDAPTGVFLGMMNDDLSRLLAYRGPAGLDSYSSTGTASDVAGGRVSYLLDLRGPNMVVNSACSSSLLAVHLACQSLHSGECGIALVAGINLMLSPDWVVRACKMGALSPDGRSKTFDANADGFGRGEGCGVVALKPLAAAQAAGDRVLAVIRGTATNHDGHGSGRTALIVPNGAAHEAMMWDALAKAGVEPAQVSYLEAHGTGTPVGDPIEVAAAGRVFGTGRLADHPLRIGSVKSNIGHLEGAAGIAGLIKTVLALNHAAIPPNLHLRQLNPAIDLARIPAEIPLTLMPWETNGAPRLAGVNSFGMGGTNAFALVEQAPSAPEPAATPDVPASGPWLLPLSARSPNALRELAERFRDYLSSGGATLDDVCHTAAARRTHHRHRLAVTGTSADELAARLDDWLRAGAITAPTQQTANIVFVFSGQGSQWPGMGRRLMSQEPVFAAAMARCDEAMRPYLERPLLEMLLADDAAESLTRSEYIQPAIFAMQIALTALWRSWGIEPQAVVGHSMAELAAAQVSGALQFEDAARLICRRARIQGRLRGQGGMLAIGLPAAEAERLLLFVADRVSIGVVNSPKSCVLSGDLDALQPIENRLQRDGIFCRRVQVDGAAHSHHLDPYLDEAREMAREIQPHATTLPMYSTVTGARVSGSELDANHWVRNLRQPVLFADALQRTLQDGHTVFLEVSPHTILSHSIQENLEIAGPVGTVLPSLRRNDDERGVLLSSLGKLYEQGYTVAWPAVYPAGRVVDLPGYPWQRQRYWDDSITRPLRHLDAGSNRHPLLSRHLRPAADHSMHFWEVDLDARGLLYLADHRVRGGTLFPGAGYLEMVIAAATEVLGEGPWTIDALRFEQGLFLPDEAARTLQLAFTTDDDGVAFQFFTDGEAGARSASVLHAAGRLRAGPSEPAAPVSLGDVRARCTQRLDGRQFYSAMEARGLQYGPAFQGVAVVHRRDGEAVGTIRLPDALTSEWRRYIVHPALLDAGLQVASAAMYETAVEANDTILPIGVDRLVWYRRLTTPNFQMLARVRETTPSADGLFHADLRLVDEAGKPVLDIHGLRLRHLPGPPDLRDPWSGWFYEPQWHATPIDDEVAGTLQEASGPWLLFADHHELAATLRRQLEDHGERCVTVTRGNTSSALAGGHAVWNPADAAALRGLMADLGRTGLVPTRVVYAWGLDVATAGAISLESLHDDQSVIMTAPLHILQSLDAASWPRPAQLVIVTRGAQQTPEDAAAPSLASAPLWGLARTIAQEHPELRTRRIDLDAAGGPDDAARLLAELRLARRAGDEVALRRGGRYESRLAPVRVAPDHSHQRDAVRADGGYLVTGGLGGLGLVTAEWLVDQGAGHLVLMGRSAPTAAAEDAIRRLEGKGATVRVVRGDVTRAADLAGVLDAIRREAPPLRGVFHSVAVLDDAPLVQTTADRGAPVLAPKIDASWALHQLTQDDPLDFFVLYSSVSSLLGFASQGIYAAGNAFMDALAHYRRARGQAALSINWGPWADVGLAARLNEGLRDRLTSIGLKTISPARGRWALTQMLSAQAIPPQIGVLSGDWASVRQSFHLGATLLRDAPRPLSDAAAMAREAPADSLVEALEQMPRSRWLELVSRHVSLQVAKALGYPLSRKLDPAVGFFDLGMDSLRAADLRNSLQAASGLTLRSMVAFEHPTIDELSAHLLAELEALAHPPAQAESVAD